MVRLADIRPATRIRFLPELATFGRYLGRITWNDITWHAIYLDDGRALYVQRKDIKPL